MTTPIRPVKPIRIGTHTETTGAVPAKQSQPKPVKALPRPGAVPVPVRAVAKPVPVRPKPRLEAEPVRALPRPRREPEEDDDDEIEEIEARPVKRASQRFLEEQDFDPDDVQAAVEYEEEVEPRKEVTPQERRRMFANPCADEPEEIEHEKPEPSKSRAVTSAETKPAKANAELDPDDEDDVSEEPQRTTSLAEFTEVIGRVPVVSTPVFQPSSALVIEAKPADATAVASSATAVVVSGPGAPPAVHVPNHDRDMRGKVMELMKQGLTDASISLRLDMPLDSVLLVRRDFLKLSKANNPREMFVRRIEDLDDMFEVAKSGFYDNPGNEVSVRAITDFTRSMREVMESYRQLEDPSAQAVEVIKRVLQPLLMAQINNAVAVMGKFKDDATRFVPDHVKRVMDAGVATHARGLSSSSTELYNKAVATLEGIFGVDLSTQRLHQNLKDNEDN